MGKSLFLFGFFFVVLHSPGSAQENLQSQVEKLFSIGDQVGIYDLLRKPGNQAEVNRNAYLLRRIAIAAACTGRYKQAEAYFELLASGKPNDPLSLNSAAWFWASAGDKDYRDGKRAVALALRACELTKFSEPAYLDTAAAAYAELGEFTKAVKGQKRAVELAKDNKNLQENLKLFQAKMRVADGYPGDGEVIVHNLSLIHI